MSLPYRALVLRPGDRVAVIAPSGPLPEERFAAGLTLLSARYEVVHSGGLMSRSGYLAGDDGRRLAELRWALGDPSVRAVFCGRGGYGAMRYLPALMEVRAEDRRAVPLVGFSDVTVLLLWQAQAGIASVHGPVVTQLGALPGEDVAALFALLEGAPPADLTGLQALHGGRAEGRLLGGNLEMLSRLCGTPLGQALRPPSGEPVILLLEEVGEAPYRIDRALTQLLLAGLLDQVAGVIVGELTDCQGVGQALDVVGERLGSLGVPVLAGAPIGHGGRNRAVPIGAPVAIDGAAGMLRFLAGSSLGGHDPCIGPKGQGLDPGC